MNDQDQRILQPSRKFFFQAEFELYAFFFFKKQTYVVKIWYF